MVAETVRIFPQSGHGNALNMAVTRLSQQDRVEVATNYLLLHAAQAEVSQILWGLSREFSSSAACREHVRNAFREAQKMRRSPGGGLQPQISKGGLLGVIGSMVESWLRQEEDEEECFRFLVSQYPAKDPYPWRDQDVVKDLEKIVAGQFEHHVRLSASELDAYILLPETPPELASLLTKRRARMLSAETSRWEAGVRQALDLPERVEGSLSLLGEAVSILRQACANVRLWEQKARDHQAVDTVSVRILTSTEARATVEIRPGARQTSVTAFLEDLAQLHAQETGMKVVCTYKRAERR